MAKHYEAGKFDYKLFDEAFRQLLEEAESRAEQQRLARMEPQGKDGDKGRSSRGVKTSKTGGTGQQRSAVESNDDDDESTDSNPRQDCDHAATTHPTNGRELPANGSAFNQNALQKRVAKKKPARGRGRGPGAAPREGGKDGAKGFEGSKGRGSHRSDWKTLSGVRKEAKLDYSTPGETEG